MLTVEGTPGPAGDEGSSQSALLRRTLGLLLSRIGLLSLSFFFGIAVARALSPAQRGHFALLQNLTGFTFVAANLAITRALIYRVGKDLLSPKEAASVAPAMALVSGLGGALILIPIILPMKEILFSAISPEWIVAGIFLATPLILREYLTGALISAARPVPIFVANATQPIAAAALLVPLLIMGTTSLSSVATSWAIGIVLSGAVALAVSIVSLQGLPRLPKPGDLQLVRFGMRIYPAHITRFLNLRLDQFLVAWLASAGALGYYAVAVTVGELLLQVPVIMLWVVSGAMSSEPAQQSGRLTIQVCRWSIIVLLASSLVIGLLAPVAVPRLFGDDYGPAVSAVLMLLPGMVAYAPALILGEYFIVQRGEPGRATSMAVASLVMGTLLNLMLTPRLGAAGASIASSCSYVAMLLLAIRFFHRDTGIRGREMFSIGISDLRDMARALRSLARRAGSVAP